MIGGMAMLPADQTKMRSHERHSMELTPDNPFFYQICRYLEFFVISIHSYLMKVALYGPTCSESLDVPNLAGHHNPSNNLYHLGHPY